MPWNEREFVRQNHRVQWFKLYADPLELTRREFAPHMT